LAEFNSRAAFPLAGAQRFHTTNNPQSCALCQSPSGSGVETGGERRHFSRESWNF